MKTFMAPAWLKKESHDGTITHMPTLHPGYSGTPPCVTRITVPDDTPYSSEVWHLTIGPEGVETYVLINLDHATLKHGMLALEAEAECTCTNAHCSAACMISSIHHEGGTLCSCSCQ